MPHFGIINTLHPRCVTCNTPLSTKEEKLRILLQKGRTMKEAMEELEINNLCCRRHVMSPDVRPLGDFISDPNARSKLSSVNTMEPKVAPTKSALMSVREENGKNVVVSFSISRKNLIQSTLDVDNGSLDTDPLKAGSIGRAQLLIMSPEPSESPFKASNEKSADKVRKILETPFEIDQNLRS